MLRKEREKECIALGDIWDICEKQVHVYLLGFLYICRLSSVQVAVQHDEIVFISVYYCATYLVTDFLQSTALSTQNYMTFLSVFLSNYLASLSTRIPYHIYQESG